MTGRVILVGQIGAAHGLKGEVKLLSFTADPGAIASYGPLLMGDSPGAGEIEIERLAAAKSGFHARFKGVADRTAAEKLKGVKLYVLRARLPEPEPGSYYHADLLGLAVQDGTGRALGKVTEVVDYGAGDLLAVAPPEGGESVLIPFKGAAVDLAAGQITVDLPEGYFEA
jgi:16S rRNA processing protein RimM